MLFSRKSVSGYDVYFGNSPVFWRSKKQATISHCSRKLEYRALGSLSYELIWVLKVLYDLGFKIIVPINVFCDKKSAIKLALNLVFHDKIMHFEINVHFIREKISKGVIKLVEISSSNQMENILTKSLVSSQHEVLFEKLCPVNHFYSK